MSTFWSLWIIVLTLACLALVIWVLFANRKVAVRDDQDPENRTTGHVYDGIEEYDNPLPRWWFNMFIATLIFGAIWLLLYPGLGSWKGLLGWTSVGELKADQEKALASYEQSYGVFNQMSVEELIDNPKAMKMGARLFANNCAVCHGADAGGNFGFPDLSDGDWLYGGKPEQIRDSITNGRNGAMPPWGAILGEAKVAQVADYVLSLSGAEHDAASAADGASVFAQNCAACHGADGKGMHALGAPNLTDDIWLYDGSREGIMHSVRNGRANQMPAQKDLLREDKIHVLTAYVYSLSQE
ncbi:cytochrome-c oxidase, cbb3-type subunit III [Agaribacterium haliotis]|uniref:cytochrome-c oxidase, cbb3-type subunit III n=1 Tax=Agaribacterium haliotis TaxID=2013869 RepID=UPI001864F841|nr:cytochrome-c oxidase, cbb3-type subunit III [Agaribacterium haliotis]